MTFPSRYLIASCIATALVAQSPTAVLKLVPASADSVELTWRLADANERYLKATEVLHTKEGLVNLQSDHLELADLAPGTVAEVHFANPAPTPKSAPKADPERKEPKWIVLLVPVKNTKALAKRLQAKSSGAVLHYKWKSEDGTQERWLGFRDGYAAVAERKELLEQVLKPGSSLESELAPITPWLLEHDSVIVASEKAVQRVAKGLAEEAKKPADTGSSTMMFSSLLKGLGEKIETSVHHAAAALDLPKDGSLRLTARAFFKAGSPLAVEAASQPALSGHPLGHLPQGAYAMAMGGQWPLSLRFFQKMTRQMPGLKPEDQETLAKLAAQVEAQVLQTSFRFQAPAQAGDPLMQGASGVSELKDGKAWLEAAKRQQAWMQEHLGETFSYQEGVLPDLPSLTVSIDLRKLGGQVSAMQMAMIGGMLFGGNRMQISYALVDEHTLAYTFGERDALKRLVDQVRENKLLASAKGIQGVDSLLPKDGRFVLYLDPRGVQALASAVANSFAGPGKGISLPELAETLPLAGALSMDPTGIQFSGSARPESLEAMGQVFTGISQAFSKDKDKAEPGKETEEPDDPDDADDEGGGDDEEA